MAQSMCILHYDSNQAIPPIASGLCGRQAGWQVDEIIMENLKILYKVNHLDSYFVQLTLAQQPLLLVWCSQTAFLSFLPTQKQKRKKSGLVTPDHTIIALPKHLSKHSLCVKDVYKPNIFISIFTINYKQLLRSGYYSQSPASYRN